MILTRTKSKREKPCQSLNKCVSSNDFLPLLAELKKNHHRVSQIILRPKNFYEVHFYPAQYEQTELI